MLDSSDANSLNTQILQLKEENRQLKQRVAYVSSNQPPQKYQLSCLKYIPWHRLTSASSSQVQGLNTQWQKYDSSREDYIRGLCQRLKEGPEQGLVPGLGSVSSGLLHQEISRLNALLEDKISECEQLEREVETIRRKGKERIQTLEQQVRPLTYFWLKSPLFGTPPPNSLLTYSLISLPAGPHLHG